ncbi:peptidase [Chloropicon primus]|uniref:Peptidase n=1 Tax=Chloropicon primus TaxID=1764295 RepID=A0A5B8MY81_9CHLO|nr:peptidase [Chloropicon primus]|eukprot:QDZ24490.1 peptidase [Chloropicon primus]
MRFVVSYLRAHGVKSYACVNVLVFQEEISRVEECLVTLRDSGVDAIIVQDFGVMKLAREVVPELEVHASTQCSVSSAQGSRHVQSLGATRVVLGRELSLREIGKVARDLESGGDHPIELEVFCHGALCVSYSGQCFSSEAWGGRSANRGQCAQACRMPYGLLVDGKLKDLQDFSYLLSPQDLSALALVPQLMDAGVSCLKIEGRLKGPEYVAITTRMYREAVDKAWEQRHGAASEHSAPSADDEMRERRRMLGQIFARAQDEDNDGLSDGFLVPDHQKVVIGRSPRHRGVYLGIVESINRRRRTVTIRTPGPGKRVVDLKENDGLVFDNGRPELEEAGGTVVQAVQRQKYLVEVGFRQINLSCVNVGDRAFRNKDPGLEKEIRSMESMKLEERKNGMRRPVAVEVSGKLGEPFRVTIRDDERGGSVVEATSHARLEEARKQALTEESVARAVGQLGGTPFRVQSFEFNVDENLFLPMNEIKEARRKAITEMMEKPSEPPGSLAVVPSTAVSSSPRDREVVEAIESEVSPRLTVLCRNPDQVSAELLSLDFVDEICLDFLSLEGLKESVRRVQGAGKRAIVALPRVLKPSEENMVASLSKLSDTLLVRNTAQLEQLQHQKSKRLYGDFSLNIANSHAAEAMTQAYGNLARFAPTHDLNADQIVRLAKGFRSSTDMEVILHHHLPIFHTEHCVFCRFLSQGSSKKDCGQPCEEHSVHLRDHLGKDHLLLADQGCRNTLFNAQAQSGARFLHDKFLVAGIRHYRIEFADEPASAVATVVKAYQELLLGHMDAADLEEQVLMKILDSNGVPQGFTTGSLEVTKERSKSVMKKTAHSLR